jgi:hypothetical protein
VPLELRINANTILAGAMCEAIVRRVSEELRIDLQRGSSYGTPISELRHDLVQEFSSTNLIATRHVEQDGVLTGAGGDGAVDAPNTRQSILALAARMTRRDISRMYSCDLLVPQT